MRSRRASHPATTAGEIIEKFRAFDLNKDGVIDARELGTVLHELDSRFWNSHRVKKMLELIDLNCDRLIQYEEFVRWTFAEPPDKKSGREHAAFASALHQLAPPMKAPRESEPKDELQEALRGFFNVHATRKSLDLECFTEAQTILAEVLGETSDRRSGVEVFMQISSKADSSAQLAAFSTWQLQVLEAKGLERSRIIEALRRSTAAASSSARRAACLDQEAMRLGSHASGSHVIDPRIRKSSTKMQTPSRSSAGQEAEELDTGPSRMKREENLPVSPVERERRTPSRSPAGQEAKELHRVGTRAAGKGRGESSSMSRPRSQSFGVSVCNDPSFAALTERGRDCPEEYATSIENLVKYLTHGCESDDECAWVIYAWVCSHVEYDVAGFYKRAPKKSCAPDDVLVSRKSVCAGYAAIFQSLAEKAGLTVKQIVGHARNTTRDIGHDLLGKDEGRHAWSAVKLGDEWLLIDCTWGAGNTSETEFTFAFKPYFFGVPPQQLAFSHYPNDPELQMMVPPVSYRDFINQPNVNCSCFFADYELEFVPKFNPEGIIHPPEVVRIRAPANVKLMLKPDMDVCSQAREPQVGYDVITISFKKVRSPRTVKILATRPSVNEAEEGFFGRTWYWHVCEFSVQGS